MTLRRLLRSFINSQHPFSLIRTIPNRRLSLRNRTRRTPSPRNPHTLRRHHRRTQTSASPNTHQVRNRHTRLNGILPRRVRHTTPRSLPILLHSSGLLSILRRHRQHLHRRTAVNNMNVSRTPSNHSIMHIYQSRSSHIDRRQPSNLADKGEVISQVPDPIDSVDDQSVPAPAPPTNNVPASETHEGSSSANVTSSSPLTTETT